MSKFTRTLITGAMVAAMHLVGMTAVAHAQATDHQAALRPPSEGQVGEAWRHRQAPSRHRPPRTPPSSGCWPESASPSPAGRPPRYRPRRPPSRVGSPAG
jgi:hypothetical protein